MEILSYYLICFLEKTSRVTGSIKGTSGFSEDKVPTGNDQPHKTACHTDRSTDVS